METETPSTQLTLEELNDDQRASNRESIMQAIAAIKQKREHGQKLSVRNAATRYGVSKSTLHRYLSRDEKSLSESEGSAAEARPVRQPAPESRQVRSKASRESADKPSDKEARGQPAAAAEQPAPSAKQLELPPAPPAASPPTKSETAKETSSRSGDASQSAEKKTGDEASGIATLLAASAVAVNKRGGGASKDQSAAPKRPRVAENGKASSDSGAVDDKHSKVSDEELALDRKGGKKVSVQSLEDDLSVLQEAVEALQDRVNKLEGGNAKNNKQLGVAKV